MADEGTRADADARECLAKRGQKPSASRETGGFNLKLLWELGIKRQLN